MDNKGSIFSLPVVLLGLFITVTFLAALLPSFVSVLSSAKASDSLNCVGYNDTTNPKLSYNSSLSTNAVGCMAIGLYIPYIVLGVLIAAVAGLFGQQINYGGIGGGGGGGGQYY